MRSMARRLTRRGLLAALAATAGCSGTSEQPAGPTETVATDTPAPTPTVTSTDPTETADPVEVRTWPDEYYQGPLVSAHEHMNGPDGFWMTPGKLDWFVRWMTRNRVAQAMAITNTQLVQTVGAHDDRFVPFLFPWEAVEHDFSRLAHRLGEILDANDRYAGIGEFGLYRQAPPGGDPPIPADHPRLLKVYDMAAERDLPVMVHGGDPAHYGNGSDPVTDMEAAFEHNRACPFLVHGTFHNVTIDGQSDRVIGEAVDVLLDRHPNLYFDISGGHTSPYSYRYNDGPDDDFQTVNPSERKSREWFESKLEADGGVEYHADRLYRMFGAAMENHPDRVTWGMDASWQWHYNAWAMDTWVDVARALLGKLPSENAEQVGYRSAADLFGISVDAES